MIKLYLYHNNVFKTAEEHTSELHAVRSGQNWALLRKGNTYRIEDEDENKIKNIKYDIHMENLLGGFI